MLLLRDLYGDALEPAMNRLFPLLALVILAACSGDDTDTDVGTDTDVSTGTEADSESDTGASFGFEGTDVTVRVVGDIGVDWRVSIQKAVLGETFAINGEVAGGAASAEATFTIPDVPESDLMAIDNQEGVVYFVVLHDDADGDSLVGDNEIIGVSARVPVLFVVGVNVSWLAADLVIDGDPEIGELSDGVDLEALGHRDSVSIEAAWGDNLVDVDRMSTFSTAEVGSGIAAGRPFDVAVDTQSRFAVTVSDPLVDTRWVDSEFAADIGLELLMGLRDVDDSGSFTDGDLKTASVCFGDTAASLVYLPPTDLSFTTMLFAQLFGLPTGWSVGSTDSNQNFVILTASEALDLDIIAGDGCDSL
jgi:hypothetical protein